MTAGPSEGWYPDPLGTANTLRYWDGSGWTESIYNSGEPEKASVDGRVTGSPMRRIVGVLAGIGIFLVINGLLVGGGGAIEAGADGLLTPGDSRSRSWFVLVIGILAWLALVLIVIVVVRRSKKQVQNARSVQLESSDVIEDKRQSAAAEQSLM